MATIISTQDLIDVKRDIEDIGKAVNEKVIVSPRYGDDFKSLPMISAEFQISADAAEAAAISSAESADIATSAAQNANLSANIAEAAATAATIGAGVFETPEAGVDPVTGVADGAYFNVRSSSDESYVDEYQNVGGVPTPSGKSYPSNMAKWDASHVIDGDKDQHEINAAQKEFNNQQPTVLQLSEAKGDGIADDAPALQVLANSVDIDLKAYIFLPFYNNSYKLDSTVVIQEPMMLWGDAVPTYNRGGGKKGKILLNTLVGFNLGNGRVAGSVLDIDNKISKNPADQWTVKNLAFVPFDNATQHKTQVALLHDSRTNGPDRGFVMREVSGRDLKHVIRVENNNIQTHLANLDISGCCLSNNYLPILADGMVWSGRIVGNQIEQNSGGAIHGAFHAGLAIHDNMLEGNVNAIYIKDHPQDHNGCYLSLERNYFEGNFGDYLVKMDSFSSNSIISRGNYVSGFLSSDGITPNTAAGKPTDHFLLTNSYTSINIYDRLSATFFGAASCSEDNNLSRFMVYAEPTSLIRVATKLQDANLMTDNRVTSVNISNKVSTDIGELYEVRKSNLYTDVPLVVSAGDVVQLCFSYYSNEQGVSPTTITIVETGADGSVLFSQVGFSAEPSNGRVRTVNYIFTVPQNAKGGRTLRFNLTLSDTTKTMSILGASAKKLGKYNASAVVKTANRFIVEKSKPPFYRVSDGVAYSDILTESTIAANSTLVKTYSLTGVSSINRIEVSLGIYNADISVSARVSAADTIQVTIRNTSTVPIVIPAGTKLVYTIY